MMMQRWGIVLFYEKEAMELGSLQAGLYKKKLIDNVAPPLVGGGVTFRLMHHV